ncbi:hypothetical protein [Pseudomonas aeruginosa]|uniref:hypothetical protein n=1 Tax=Pseudomonas aeruginosa TaxID=287 RepID=UPI00244CADAC|nr:hypothetical protein [Pseudomonas aeruginosa]MDH0300066.1 hypothetical protein [Pseudomonas aeruginosa]MDH0375153.1 hypothetical protein [Pseudomonas aeruginosa]
MSKELNKAPVEQAGTNVGHGHVFPRADGVKMRCGGPGLCSECAADAYRARAALAQPSGEVVVTKNESGAIVSVTRQDKEGRVLSVIAESQPSPAQAQKAEAERPIVSFEKYMQVMYDRDENAKRLDAALARVAGLETALSSALSQHGVKFMDPPDGGDTPLIEQVYRMSQALSELEKQEPVATIAKVPGEDWNGLHFYRDLQGMQPGTKLYAAPVAQAQHSVPEGVTIERDVAGTIHIKVGDFDFIQLQYQRPYTDNASTWKLAERIASLLAAAPGKEVGHE